MISFCCKALSNVRDMLLLECNQIFRISLAVMEDDKHIGLGHIVHNTIVLLNPGGVLGRWGDHIFLSKGVIPCEHSAEIHELLPILWLGVGVPGRVFSVDCKVCAIAITSS